MTATLTLFMLAAGIIIAGWVYRLNHEVDRLTTALHGVDLDMTVVEEDLDSVYDALLDLDPKVFLRMSLQRQKTRAADLELDAQEAA